MVRNIYRVSPEYIKKYGKRFRDWSEFVWGSSYRTEGAADREARLVLPQHKLMGRLYIHGDMKNG